jgi:hypothetical protein
MLSYVTLSARRLDETLQRKLGRPYNVILAAALVGEIVRRAAELPHTLASKAGLIGIVLSILVEVALLIHQVGALDHHLAYRRRSDPTDKTAAH